jgi:hypothetical protein
VTKNKELCERIYREYHQRAVVSPSSHGWRGAGIALHKLATLHEALGQTSEAAHYYQQNLSRVDASRLQTTERQDALLFLANYKKVLLWLSDLLKPPGYLGLSLSPRLRCLLLWEPWL